MKGEYMAARLTDRQKKKIVADYVELQSYNAVSKIHGVSRQTVKNIVEKEADIGQKLQQKKEENALEALAYLDSRRAKIEEAIDLHLEVLTNKEKIEAATLSQASTSFGTLVDKLLVIKERRGNEGGEKVTVVIDV